MRATLTAWFVIGLVFIGIVAGVDLGTSDSQLSASGNGVTACGVVASYLFIADAVLACVLLTIFIVMLRSVNDVFYFKFELQVLLLCESPPLVLCTCVCILCFFLLLSSLLHPPPPPPKKKNRGFSGISSRAACAYFSVNTRGFCLHYLGTNHFDCRPCCLVIPQGFALHEQKQQDNFCLGIT